METLSSTKLVQLGNFEGEYIINNNIYNNVVLHSFFIYTSRLIVEFFWIVTIEFPTNFDKRRDQWSVSNVNFHAICAHYKNRWMGDKIMLFVLFMTPWPSLLHLIFNPGLSGQFYLFHYFLVVYRPTRLLRLDSSFSYLLFYYFGTLPSVC